MNEQAKQTEDKAPLTAWNEATKGKQLSLLLLAIGDAIVEASKTDGFEADNKLYQLSRRIATGEGDGPFCALGYMSRWHGEWEVKNEDLEIWSRFLFGLHSNNNTNRLALEYESIDRALHNKRMYQAYERYQKTGLTKDHCALLKRLLWDINTGRDHGVSIYVQGKRPLGNSNIPRDIFEDTGWPKDWDLNEGMPEAQTERAWSLFDELAFAAPDAASAAAWLLTEFNITKPIP